MTGSGTCRWPARPSARTPWAWTAQRSGGGNEIRAAGSGQWSVVRARTSGPGHRRAGARPRPTASQHDQAAAASAHEHRSPTSAPHNGQRPHARCSAPIGGSRSPWRNGVSPSRPLAQGGRGGSLPGDSGRRAELPPAGAVDRAAPASEPKDLRDPCHHVVAGHASAVMPCPQRKSGCGVTARCLPRPRRPRDNRRPEPTGTCAGLAVSRA